MASSTWLTNALRWANAAYTQIFQRYRFKHLKKKTVFRTAAGQPTYQAPSDFLGFCFLKDETNDSVMVQKTPEEFALIDANSEVTDEDFTSDHDVAVSLDNNAIAQYSETVADDTDHTTVYTRDTDYTMDYTNGTITVLSTGSMSDATTYYTDYLYRTDDKPERFSLEYDATNTKYVFRLDPCPDATYIFSLLYPHVPSALSDSVDPLWSKLEFTLERGGIYFGSLELFDDSKIHDRFKAEYETSIKELIQLDLDMIPKNDRIPLKLRRTDYQDSYGYLDRKLG